MIIDSHCHILPPSFHERRAELASKDATFATIFYRPGARMATADKLLRAMDRDGVARAVVMGMGWTNRAIAREANDYIIQSVSENPGRLTGFCSVDPGWGDDALVEVERCAALGVKGIGEIHPDSQSIDITSKEEMSPLMALARSLGLLVLVHSSEPVGHKYPGKGATTPEKLYRFIENFPENTIICAHWGGGLPFYNLMPEVPKALENVYFDSAASPFLYRPEVFAKAADLAGPDKLLFGSDYPLMAMSRPLGQARAAGLTPAAEEALLGGNAARLLGF